MKSRTTIAVDVNGSRRRVVCEQGQEEHLRHVVHYLNRRVKETKSSVGAVGETELFMLTALMLVDELSDAHEKISQLEHNLQQKNSVAPFSPRVEEQITQAAIRVEQLAKTLAGE